MPPNRSLSEYVTLVILLARLIRRLISHLSSQVPAFVGSQLSSTIGLLVGLVAGSPASIARIGFSACGKPKQRKAIIRDRRLNLPELASISGNVGWMSGNCAESEMFGHLRFMRERLLDSCVEEPEILFASLTLSLSQEGTSFDTSIKGKKMCALCHRLADTLSRAPSCRILDICP
jgi:hypothetical protein